MGVALAYTVLKVRAALVALALAGDLSLVRGLTVAYTALSARMAVALAANPALVYGALIGGLVSLIWMGAEAWGAWSAAQAVATSSKALQEQNVALAASIEKVIETGLADNSIKPAKAEEYRARLQAIRADIDSIANASFNADVLVRLSKQVRGVDLGTPGMPDIDAASKLPTAKPQDVQFARLDYDEFRNRQQFEMGLKTMTEYLNEREELVRRRWRSSYR
jgi:hypothetical protein